MSERIFTSAAPAHGINERPLLELLSRYARRWKVIYLWIDPEAVQFLTGARGNLPLLERLELHASIEREPQNELRIFEGAPRLTDAILVGRPCEFLALPWGQLLDVRFDNGTYGHFYGGFDILPLLSTDARHVFEITVASIHLPVVLQSASTISSLTIAVNASSYLARMQTVMETSERPLLLWMHNHFLHFASRSSLYASIAALEIEAGIQSDELLQCLGLLTSLERLDISDCEDYEAFISLMQFCDDSLWELLISRCMSPGWEEDPFEIQIFWLSRREREFSLQFTRRLEALKDEGLLLEIDAIMIKA
ncbi:hypothetical protein B0H17DRAFT_1213847 [Mycena rosella]|uniref:Uncharacterized protein n=1 Tax=Mycena rosella TaxID=1033263 RepID=A0AAD7CPE0_MYCRO|nr:hypothetical protein B0H17DRAFT_1213847 [Mycena rosella]